MKLLILVINTLISFFVAIGDFVIFYAGVILKIFELIVNFLINVVSKSNGTIAKDYRSFTQGLNRKRQDAKISVSLARFRVFLQMRKLRRKFHFGRKKTEPKAKQKKEEVTVYPKPRHIFLKFKYFVLGFLFCVIFILIPAGSYVFLNSLPNPHQLSEREIPQTTKIYDRNGVLLYQIYANENRTLVPLGSIPKNLINATIAIEDKDFYSNPGFDLPAIIRAALADFQGKPLQGGSTITQQLVKSTLLTPEVSISRKIKEVILAFWAEHIYTKDQILDMYFNQVPYGGTAWGIEAAAQTYFGKDVKDLDLAQCAFLAGMPQAPSTYSPYGENPNLWKGRQEEVLNRMYSLGYITKVQEQEAVNEPLTFEPPQTPIYAPHFVMYVKNYLIQRYGLPLVEKGGLNVVTSLDLKTQEMAQAVVSNEVGQDAEYNLTNGAALVTDPKNGDILAMVGSADYNSPDGGNYNVTTALRQPGSSIKVVTYAAALSNGFTAASIINDEPVTYVSAGTSPYSPVNYDHAFHGNVTLRIALANSINIPAVKTLAKIGVPTMVNLAKKMGITTWGDPNQYGLAITLGAADVKMTDMAVVYGTLANLGKKVDLNPILKITNYSGDVIYQKQEQLPLQILDPGVAYILSNILADNNARSMEFGSNSPLNVPGYTVSVKTGTSNSFRDNWTIGYTPNYLVAVWVGNNNNAPMNGLASGITGAAPIWHQIMSNLLANSQNNPEPVPADIVEKPCFGKEEFFLKDNADCPLAATPSATMTAQK